MAAPIIFSDSTFSDKPDIINFSLRSLRSSRLDISLLDFDFYRHDHLDFATLKNGNDIQYFNGFQHMQ